jgi:hypothetical protein
MDLRNRFMEWLLARFDRLMDRWSAGFWSSYRGAQHPQIRARK